MKNKKRLAAHPWYSPGAHRFFHLNQATKNTSSIKNAKTINAAAG